MTNIGKQIFNIGCQAAKIQANIPDEVNTGCPECHSNRAMRLNFRGEGIWHEYKVERYGAQFDPGDYICENDHEFKVDDYCEIIKL
jgi:hypothetical protein